MENWRVMLCERIDGGAVDTEAVRDQIIDLKNSHHVYILLYQVCSKGSLEFFIRKQPDPFIMNNHLASILETDFITANFHVPLHNPKYIKGRLKCPKMILTVSDRSSLSRMALFFKCSKHISSLYFLFSSPSLYF